jgi:isopenicillin-N N-acyltransferase-like protein
MEIGIRKKMSRVIYIEAGGTNYEIGYQMGERLKEKLISHNMARQVFYRKFAKNGKSSLSEIVASSAKLIAKYFPEYLNELRGLADGS